MNRKRGAFLAIFSLFFVLGLVVVYAIVIGGTSEVVKMYYTPSDVLNQEFTVKEYLFNLEKTVEVDSFKAFEVFSLNSGYKMGSRCAWYLKNCELDLANSFKSYFTRSNFNFGVKIVDNKFVINYEYNANGLLSGAWGIITSDSDDGFGNTTHATVDQAYTIIVGTAKLATSTSESTTTNLDLSQSTNTMITTYQYDSNGVLIGANGSGTLLGADGFGQHSQGTVTQTYEIIKGAAKLKTSTSSIEVTHDYDLSSSSTESTTTYEHDTQGKLISGFSDENTSGTDSIGNTYTSTAHRDYFVLYGQLKQKSAQTTKTSSAQDNSWTKTVIDEWYAGEGAGADPLTGYSEQGKVIRYHQVTTESGTGQLSELNGEAVTDWYAGSKDSQEDAYTQVGGWLKGYHQDTTITNYDSEGNVVFDLTTSTSRFNIQYYGQADIYPQGKMKSYEEISVSSDAPDKEKYQKVTDIRYDELTGRMLQQDFEAKEINLTEEESSADRVISITSGQKIEFTYNEYGLATSWRMA